MLQKLCTSSYENYVNEGERNFAWQSLYGVPPPCVQNAKKIFVLLNSTTINLILYL